MSDDSKTCVGCKYAEWQTTPSGKIIDLPGVCNFPLAKIKPPASAMNECEFELGPIFIDLTDCPHREED